MKKTKIYFLALALGVLGSCSSNPEACFTMDKETAAVGEAVTFTDCSTDANTVFIFTGDGKVGEFTNGKYSYAYPTAGTYTVEVTATDIEDQQGGNSTTASKTIVITE